MVVVIKSLFILCCVEMKIYSCDFKFVLFKFFDILISIEENYINNKYC